MTMLIGPRHEAVNVAALVGDPDRGVGIQNPGVTGFGERLLPRPLTDGLYAVPESVLTEPGYEAAVPILAGWTPTEFVPSYAALGSPPVNGFGHRLAVNVSGRYFFQFGRSSALTMPHPNVFRWEVSEGDAAHEGDVTDPISPNRRVEIVNRDYIYSGNTVWVSFTLIFGDTPGAALGIQGNVLQFHGVGTLPNLVLLAGGWEFDNPNSGPTMRLYTRSSAFTYSDGNGQPVWRWSAPQPAKGVPTHFVIQATYGQAGHLNLWVNGTQVFNADIPIGLYAIPETRLGYLQFGNYQQDRPGTDVIYHANVEYTMDGTSLLSRVASPLSVPDLDW